MHYREGVERKKCRRQVNEHGTRNKEKEDERKCSRERTRRQNRMKLILLKERCWKRIHLRKGRKKNVGQMNEKKAENAEKAEKEYSRQKIIISGHIIMLLHLQLSMSETFNLSGQSMKRKCQDKIQGTMGMLQI